MENIEDVNYKLNAMTESQQIEYYIKDYNATKVFYKQNLLRLMETTGKNRDDIMKTLNEALLQIDKNLNEIYKYNDTLMLRKQLVKELFDFFEYNEDY